MIVLELYTKNDCSLCVKAKSTILHLRERIPFTFREIILVPGSDLENSLRNDIPVLHINGEFHSHHFISERELRQRLEELVTSGQS